MRQVRLKKVFLPVLMLLLLAQCKKKDNIPPEKTFLPSVSEYNYAYGPAPTQNMDVFIPAGKRDTMKLLVMVHGGSWISRDKSDFSPWFEYEKQRQHYAVININYRLDTYATRPVPMQTDDIRSAIEKVRHDFHLPARRIGLLGMSAGGHLVTLYAYKYDTEHNVKTVVDFVGPVDFTDPVYHSGRHWPYIFSGIEYIFNMTYRGNEDYYRSVSPYYNVDAQSPPTIMFYGGQDTLVPASQGVRLRQQLNRFSVPNELYIYPGSPHAFNDTDAMDAFWKAERFMSEYL